MLNYGTFQGNPVLEQFGFRHDSVIVDLISATNHAVEGPHLVRVENIPPKWVGATVWIWINGICEAIAAVEHDVHCFPSSRHPEACWCRFVDPISWAHTISMHILGVGTLGFLEPVGIEKGRFSAMMNEGWIAFHLLLLIAIEGSRRKPSGNQTDLYVGSETPMQPQY